MYIILLLKTTYDISNSSKFSNQNLRCYRLKKHEKKTHTHIVVKPIHFFATNGVSKRLRELVLWYK